jgi:uncharacterized membrane protein
MNTRGQTIVLFAVLVTGLLLFLLGILDLGLLRTKRATLQHAADAAVLAGASGFLDGDPGGDSARVRVAQYVELNPVAGQVPEIDSIGVFPESAVAAVQLSLYTPALFARSGITLRAYAAARVSLVTEGQTGRPVPNGNAYGWYRQEKNSKPGASDSARIALIQ